MGISTAIGVISGLATLGDIMHGWIKNGTIEGGFAGFFDPDFDQEAAFNAMDGRFDGIDESLGKLETKIVSLMDDVDTLAADVEAQGRSLSTNIDSTALAEVRGEVYSVLARVSHFDERTDAAADLISQSSLAFGSAYELANDILSDSQATPEAIAAAVGTVTYALSARLVVAQTVEEGGHREGDVQQNVSDTVNVLDDLREHLRDALDIDVGLGHSSEKITEPSYYTVSEPIYWNFGPFGYIKVGEKQVTHRFDKVVGSSHTIEASVASDGFGSLPQDNLIEALSQITFWGAEVEGGKISFTTGWHGMTQTGGASFSLPDLESTDAFLESYSGTRSFDLTTYAGRQMLDAYLDFHVENLVLEDLGFGYGGAALQRASDTYRDISRSTEQDKNSGPVSGTQGDDYIKGSDGGDTIDGGDGNDVLVGHGGDDRLFGGDGNDILKGGTGNDRLYGGAGDDAYMGGAGNDRITDAGGDNDRARFDGQLAEHTLKMVGNQLHVSNGAETDYLTGIDFLQFDDVTIATGKIGTDGDDRISGTFQADYIHGGAGDDVLRGNSGDDWIVAGRGNDVIHGGHGDDTMDGGAGNDVFHDVGWTSDLYVASSGNDIIKDYYGSRDTIEFDGASADYSIVLTGVSQSWMGASPRVTVTGPDGITQMRGIEVLEFHDRTLNWRDIEQTLMVSEGADVATGTGLGEIIFGRGGNDVIDGRGGNDKLNGGEGIDILTGGDGEDQFIFDLGDRGVDTVTDFDATEGDVLVIRNTDGSTFEAAFLAERSEIDDYGRLLLDLDGDGADLPVHVANLSSDIVITEDLFV